jgi:hypothetical protein
VTRPGSRQQKLSESVGHWLHSTSATAEVFVQTNKSSSVLGKHACPLSAARGYRSRPKRHQHADATHHVGAITSL